MKKRPHSKNQVAAAPIADVWREAFAPALSRRIADTLTALAAWRDRQPAAKRRTLLSVWPELERELAVTLVKEFGAAAPATRARQPKFIVLHGRPPLPAANSPQSPDAA